MHFEIERNHDGQYHWRLKAANGRIIADSGETYKNKQDCIDALNLVKGANLTRVVDKTGGPPTTLLEALGLRPPK